MLKGDIVLVRGLPFGGDNLSLVLVTHEPLSHGGSYRGIIIDGEDDRWNPDGDSRHAMTEWYFSVDNVVEIVEEA